MKPKMTQKKIQLTHIELEKVCAFNVVVDPDKLPITVTLHGTFMLAHIHGDGGEHCRVSNSCTWIANQFKDVAHLDLEDRVERFAHLAWVYAHTISPEREKLTVEFLPPKQVCEWTDSGKFTWAWAQRHGQIKE